MPVSRRYLAAALLLAATTAWVTTRPYVPCTGDAWFCVSEAELAKLAFVVLVVPLVLAVAPRVLGVPHPWLVGFGSVVALVLAAVVAGDLGDLLPDGTAWTGVLAVVVVVLAAWAGTVTPRLAAAHWRVRLGVLAAVYVVLLVVGS